MASSNWQATTGKATCRLQKPNRSALARWEFRRVQLRIVRSTKQKGSQSSRANSSDTYPIMPLKQDGKYVLNSIGSRSKVCHRPTSFQPANKEEYTCCTGPCRLTRLKQCMHMHVCHPWSNSPAADRNPTALIVVLRYHALMARMWSASLSSFVRASNSMPKCNLNKHEDDHARYDDA